MIEAVIAGIAVAMLSPTLGIPADAFWPATGITWAVIYLLSCRWRPYRACPWPWCTKRKPIQRDSRGNYRRRRPCRACGGGDWRRIGARLIGAG